MGMQFMVTLTGDITANIEASDLGIDTDNPNDLLDVSSRVGFEDVSVSGTVELTASVRIEYVEVDAEDLEGYDADTAIGDYVDPYGGVSVSNAEFEITEEPTGFDTVVEAVNYDRDVAISVYAALSRAGYEVS